jgi:hypothetical protein
MAEVANVALRGGAQRVISASPGGRVLTEVSASVTHVPGLICYQSSRLNKPAVRCSLMFDALGHPPNETKARFHDLPPWPIGSPDPPEATPTVGSSAPERSRS